MKKYQNPVLTLLTLTCEDILNLSGEPSLIPIDREGESIEIFGGFTPYQ